MLTSKPTLPAAEQQIIRAKYSAKQIGLMDDNEKRRWGKSLLLKIHVITGWVIPESELMNILSDQFQKKLSESYADMNVEEIELSFRKGGTTVKDWGKAMNLALIDEVLIPYLEERKRLSHEVEEKGVPVVQKVYTDQELDNLHREDVENFYQRLRSGIVPEGIPTYFKDILEKDGLLKEETLVDFFTRKINSGAGNIYRRAD